MNMRSITLNIPEAGAPPHEYVAAVHQAISEYTSRGDLASALAIGGLLTVAGFGAAALAGPISGWPIDPRRSEW